MEPIICKDKFMNNYLIAPYNFISFPKRAAFPYKSREDLPSHGKYDKKRELLNGYIDYTIKAKTPIMVDSGKMDKDNRQAEFFKNPEGKYAIPGNTMRGLVRTNCQIISSSPVSDEIEDQQFLFRDIASNTYLSDKYKETLGIKGRGIARNLKVGYMERKNGRYYIRESERLDDDYPYLDVKELDLHKGLGLNLDKTNLMYKRNILKDEAKIKDLNKKIGRAIFAKGRKNWGEINSNRRTRDRIISSHRNRNFTPYYKEVSFDYDRKKRRITRISKPGDCQYNGYLLSSNYILGKMAHYIVPAPLENMGEVEVDERSIEAYKNDLVITNKADKTSQGVRIKKGDEYYDLPAEGEIKPVFYINSQTGFHFGFTPNLRIMYPASVHDGLEESYMARDLISYTDAIFGFINKGRNKESYKGRVNFTDLIAEDGRVDKEAAIDLILAGPKPTSFNLYLEQDPDKYGKNWANIYEGDFSLAGFKKYWLKDYIEEPNLENANKNMVFTINPLGAGTEFKGRIYFDNLRAEELGLLLYSIRLREGSNQNIGMAKPYGYGRIEFTDISLKIEDLDTKYGGFNFYYHKLANVDQYIDKFKTSFSQEFLGADDKDAIDEQDHMKELFKMTETVVSKDKCNFYRYMVMQDKEFDKAKYLPEVLDYEEKQKEKKRDIRSKKGSRKNNKRKKSKTPKMPSGELDNTGVWDVLKKLDLDD